MLWEPVAAPYMGNSAVGIHWAAWPPLTALGGLGMLGTSGQPREAGSLGSPLGFASVWVLVSVGTQFVLWGLAVVETFLSNSLSYQIAPWLEGGFWWGLLLAPIGISGLPAPSVPDLGSTG